MELLSAFLVVISQGNNPRLLNPDFLVNNGIVPKNWEVRDLLVLPPVSRILYANKVEVTLEEQKLSVRAHDPSMIDWGTELPKICIGIISTLPHVLYGAVGLNFEMIESVPDSGEDKQTFLQIIVKEGPWLNYSEETRVSGIKFQYRLSDAILNLSVERVVRQLEDRPSSQNIKYDFNFHRDFESSENDDRRDFLNTFSERSPQLFDLLKQFVLE